MATTLITESDRFRKITNTRAHNGSSSPAEAGDTFITKQSIQSSDSSHVGRWKLNCTKERISSVRMVIGDGKYMILFKLVDKLKKFN